MSSQNIMPRSSRFTLVFGIGFGLAFGGGGVFFTGGGALGGAKGLAWMAQVVAYITAHTKNARILGGVLTPKPAEMDE